VASGSELPRQAGSPYSVSSNTTKRVKVVPNMGGSNNNNAAAPLHLAQS
jgi:hypothetical protein